MFILYVQKFLVVEESTFSYNITYRLYIFNKNCPQFGKDIVKIKGVVFL